MTSHEVGVMQALVHLVNHFKTETDVKGLRETCEYVTKAAKKLIENYEKETKDIRTHRPTNHNNW